MTRLETFWKTFGKILIGLFPSQLTILGEFLRRGFQRLDAQISVPGPVHVPETVAQRTNTEMGGEIERPPIPLKMFDGEMDEGWGFTIATTHKREELGTRHR